MTPATETNGAAPAVERDPPILLGLEGAAAFCGMTPREFQGHHAAGRVPMPITIGRRLHFRRADLVAWVNMGCPSRRVFEESRQRKETA